MTNAGIVSQGDLVEESTLQSNKEHPSVVPTIRAEVRHVGLGYFEPSNMGCGDGERGALAGASGDLNSSHPTLLSSC